MQGSGVENQGLALWYMMGMHHVARAEGWTSQPRPAMRLPRTP
jgi:Cu2+-containing amine oxidase